MKKLVNVVLMIGIFGIALLFNSCEKDPDEPTNPTGLMPGDTIALMDVTETLPAPLQYIPWQNLYYPNGFEETWDTVLIFNSIEELQAMFSEAPHNAELLLTSLDEAPHIDFTNQSLILCGGENTSGIAEYKSQLSFLAENYFHMNVKVLLGHEIFPSLTQEWTRYYLTSSKIESISTIDFELEMFSADEYDEFMNE